jgi:VWFA-related protein
MGKWTVWLLVVAIAFPSFAADRAISGQVSVEQLERMLAASKGKGDAEIAKQLSSTELTERLSSAKFEQLKVGLPGEKSQRALLALADTAAFLNPPSSEIPATAPPNASTQRRMMALAVAYLAKTLPLLPNLSATRETIRFETHPSRFDEGPPAENPLRPVSRSVVTVFYRDGKEYMDSGASQGSKSRSADKGLTTWGEFGPILGTILIDAARSQLVWSHWELGGSGPQAVFRYSVPKEKSHYEVRFCCVTQSYGMEVDYLSQRVGYHGEITLDPDSGMILRLTVIADPEAGNPISLASLVVEYGPEEMGGKTYFCPVRGIALARSPDLNSLSSALTRLPSAGVSGATTSLQKTNLASSTGSPQQLLLNDVSFRQYHLFRSDARILTGSEADAASHSAAVSPSIVGNPSQSERAKPSEETLAENSAAPQPAAPAEAVSTPGPPAEPVIPEVSVTGASGLPDTPSIAASANPDSSTVFRVNARLVDVSLVALDKKGRPVTNLKPEDLEILDNGNKVDLRYFSQANAAKPAQSAGSTQSSVAADQPAFSNRRVEPAKPAPGAVQDNTIILLIDNTLSFDDLSNVREQMGRFLMTLHENERVAIYVMRVGRFQILQNATTDYALLAGTLAKWTPSAGNISLGEEQEARNRQQMDYVHNTEDLLSVNGHGLADNESQTQALDPQLRDLGDNPGRDALAGLVLLARHLASVPGHKSLVWIASDNVLADWTNAALNIDKGSRYIEPTALRAQEAMNDAHVSVYPLDASRLEAGGLDARMGTMNVALNPAASANQMGGCGLVTAAGSRSAQGAGNGTELQAGADISTCGKNLDPGRIKAQMQQDLHPIQGVYREIADATGGRTFRRASDIVTELNDVAADGRATYLLSFTPPQAADGKYHFITVKLAGHKDVSLRYRTGYFYRQEPATIKDRFREAVVQPEDVTEIGLTADLLPATAGRGVKLGIAATDLAVAQKDAFWADKLDVYLVQREASGTKANVTGQSMVLRLQPATYQKYLREGIPFNQVLEIAPGVSSIRVIVVDENSGRMGSITIPVEELRKAS